MVDQERTSFLKKKLESMKESKGDAIEEGKTSAISTINSLLTIAFRVTFIYFAQSILLTRYPALGLPFGFWDVVILYFGIGSFMTLFRTEKK